MNLTIKLTTDSDGAFCASVDELPGVFERATTISGAFAEIGLSLEAALRNIQQYDPARYAELMEGGSDGEQAMTTHNKPDSMGIDLHHVFCRKDDEDITEDEHMRFLEDLADWVSERGYFSGGGSYLSRGDEDDD